MFFNISSVFIDIPHFEAAILDFPISAQTSMNLPVNTIQVTIVTQCFWNFYCTLVWVRSRPHSKMKNINLYTAFIERCISDTFCHSEALHNIITLVYGLFNHLHAFSTPRCRNGLIILTINDQHSNQVFTLSEWMPTSENFEGTIGPRNGQPFGYEVDALPLRYRCWHLCTFVTLLNIFVIFYKSDNI